MLNFQLEMGGSMMQLSGYYYNLAKGYYYDPNSGLFYSNEIGKWITEEEAFKTSQISRPDTGSSSQTKGAKSEQVPCLVFSTSLNPSRPVKGTPSSITVSKRKRENEKTKVISKEEDETLKAREAAKKRMEEREKPLMGILIFMPQELPLGFKEPNKRGLMGTNSIFGHFQDYV